jgi:hypothetical protein
MTRAVLYDVAYQCRFKVQLDRYDDTDIEYVPRGVGIV